MTARHNVLLIHWHDLGRHLGCYGAGDVPSPVMDSLAAQGFLFERAHATAPLCSPARGSLFTGRYPHSTGLTGLAHHGFEYGSDVRTLPTILGEYGWDSALFGMQHESRDPNSIGFDEVDVTDARCDYVADRVQEWLSARQSSTPFFLTAGFFETHRPYPSEEYPPADPAQVPVPGFLPDDPAVREDLAGLHGAIAQADAAVGRLLDVIAELGLADSTWIVFVTDHGLAFPRAKSTLYDAGTGIAAIIRPPTGAGFAPQRYEDLFSGVDLVPTLLDFLGVPIPDAVEGVSHVAALTGRTTVPARDELFTEKTYHDTYDPIRAIRTTEFSYLENFADRRALELPLDIAQSPSASALDGSENAPRPARELYDLVVDPHERHNVIDQPAYQWVQRRLARRLRQWRAETEDVIPAPADGEAIARAFMASFFARRGELPSREPRAADRDLWAKSSHTESLARAR